MIKIPSIKAVCDHCKNTIVEDISPKASERIVNECVKKSGGLVLKNKHFCNPGCFKDFCDANVSGGDE